MLTIRRHGVDGLDDAMTVMARAFDTRFGEAWTASQCAGVLAMPGAALLVARAPQPCGFALLRTVADEAELMLLAIVPEVRRQGIGRALLRETMAIAVTEGASLYFLEVREDNPAIKLYIDEELSVVGRRSSYYTGGDGKRRDALTFRRSLL